MTTPEFRVVFDAAVTFSNGGDLAVTDFRLDAPGPEVDADWVAGALIDHLGLLMVGEVSVRNLRVTAEQHKGSRKVAVGTAGSRRLIDLTHVITAGMTTYPGLPGPEIGEHLTREASRQIYASGTEFVIGRITMVGNTGTYLDSPFHRYAEGFDLSGMPLTSVADLPVCLLRWSGATERGIGSNALRSLDIAGKAVLLQTGWDRHFGSPAYGDPAPHLTADGAAFLVEAGAALVGIDSVNIDDTHSGGERPAHSRLLAAGIPVLEHLTRLDQLPATGGRLHAAPPPIAGFGTFPVRAYVVVCDEGRS